MLNGHTWPEIISRIYTKLKNGGVWYQVELLPIDMPANWLYRYFPAAWEWGKSHAWSLHSIYNQHRQQGFQVDVQRHMYYQSVSLSKSLEIVEKRPGLLSNLPDEVFEEGINTLIGEIHEKGDDYLLGSEFALLEIWAQKPLTVV